MKAVSIPEIVSRLRQRRNGRTFIAEFINQCEWVDTIPLDRINQAREDMENISWKSCTSKIVDGNRIRTELIDRKDALEILDKLIAESEEK